MCGEAAPQLALELIERALMPASRVVKTVERGAIIPALS
jgi:S-adenosylmethionine decarboxylase